MSTTDGPLARMKAIADEQRATLAPRKERPPYPNGWTPRITTSAVEGEAISDYYTEESVDERALLEG